MRKIVVTFLIFISIVFMGLGIFGAISNNDNTNDNKPSENTPEVVGPKNKSISCVYSEYQDIYSAMVETTVDVDFDNNDNVDISKTTMKFMFNDFNNYNTWKQVYDSDNIDMNVPGVTSNVEFDDNNMVLTSIIQQKYSETPQENINDEMPIDYENLKTYFINNGYFCTES